MHTSRDTFRKLGVRATKGRIAILDLFAGGCRPRTADEIADALHAGRHPIHRTTVYRELHTLEELGLLVAVDLGGSARRYDSAENHHHHIRCTRCGRIAALSGEQDLLALEQRVARETGFRLLGHTLEFTGLCSACSTHGA